MKEFMSIGFNFLFAIVCFGQAMPDSMRYFGQTPPGDAPKVFAPSYVSGTGWVNTLSFSSDGEKMVFTKWINGSHPKIFYSEYSDSQGWSLPAQKDFTGMYEMEGVFAPFGNRMFFAAGDMSGGKWAPDDIWKIEKQPVGWSIPVKVNEVNTSHYEFFATQALDTTIFFQRSTNSADNIYYLTYGNGGFSTPIKMAEPINSSTRSSYHPCISPDCSFLIIELGNNSNNDLWVSFRKSNNSWSVLKNFGNKINTPQFIEGKPTLSPNGKYLFFSRQNNSVCDIYWVRVDNLIDSLKHSNFTPYLNTKIANQTDTVGHSFSYTFPDSTFIDDDGNNTLTYSATLNKGNSLPAWLSFNSTTRTFAGTPTSTEVSSINVTAADTANASASCMFKITIVAGPTGVEEDKNQLPKGFALKQNHPNPFNPSTVINYQLSFNSNVKLSIFDARGREVATLVNEEKPEGSYAVQWNAAGMPGGIYFYRLQAGAFTETKKLVLLR
jgi:hypothetical protein